MPISKAILFALLGAIAALFVGIWFWNLWRQRGWQRPTAYQILVGFVTNFFDTLGIGSFATTTALFRIRHTIDDKNRLTLPA